MKFYHNFHTDLPDQFVQANADRLKAWAAKYAVKNAYFKHNDHVDAVPIVLVEDRRDRRYPTFKAAVPRMLENWMQRKGDQYDGRYWEALTEDQRSPARTADWGAAALNSGLSSWFAPGGVTYSNQLAGLANQNAGPGLTAKDLLRIQRQMVTGIWEEEERPPLKREKIVAGEIVGYRCWIIQNGLLRSVYQTDVWRPGNPLEGRELGDWDQRGIHAWKDAGGKEYHDYIRSYLNYDNDSVFILFMQGDQPKREKRPAMVTGTVWLWGDVVEHERGYRAEFARVRSIDWLYPDAAMMGREQQALAELRSRYAVSSPVGKGEA